jgi:hypothetical protein
MQSMTSVQSIGINIINYRIATTCNKKKILTKKIVYQSNLLFFSLLLDSNGPMNTQAIVIGLNKYCVNAILRDSAFQVRLQLNMIKNTTSTFMIVEDNVPMLNLNWVTLGIVQVCKLIIQEEKIKYKLISGYFSRHPPHMNTQTKTGLALRIFRYEYS